MLCTTPFDVTARNIARVMGLPDYPFVLLEHPLGSADADGLAARARAAADSAEGILLR